MTLAFDIIAINKISLMVTTSRNIHFGTAKLIQDKTENTIMTSIRQVVQTYNVRGFRVCKILAEGGFECTRYELSEMDIALNVTLRNEHVTEIER